jgi:hypothetical protein
VVSGGLVVSAVALAACSTEVDLPRFNDVQTAPAPIRTSARAVVRVATAGEMATGWFVSPQGLLVTNNHVLGETICPIEGCGVAVTVMYQRGEPVPRPLNLYAVPVAVAPGLDFALVQLTYDQGGAPFLSPDYLVIDPLDAATLVGRHVTVVGHPEGHLKQWTDGVVTDVRGSWIIDTAFVLPGDSGSPMLEDDGRVVGLIHRSPSAADLIASHDVNVYSIGTATAPIEAAMSAPLPSSVISVKMPLTEAELVAKDRIFLNSRQVAAIVTDGSSSVSTSVLQVLGHACDAALARPEFTSPDDLSAALLPCTHAVSWIDCRADHPSTPYPTECPSGSDAVAWENRFIQINQEWLAMNGQMDLNGISFDIARLASSKSAGIAAGRQTLAAALASANPWLDFSLANYLAAFDIPTYGGVDLASYVRGYAKVLHYELQARDIASAAGWLYDDHLLDRSTLSSILGALESDGSVSVGDKLYIEDLRYQLGVL